MFKEIFNLVDTISIFNLFQYITFRAGFASITSMLLALFIGPKLIKYLVSKKAEQTIRTDGPQTHQVKVGTPTMGGILILLSVIISILLWQDLHNKYTWVVLSALIGYGFIGFLDDYLKIFKKNPEGLKAKYKFILQLLISTAIVVYLFFNVKDISKLYLPFIKNSVLDMSYLYIPFAIILLTGFSNAVNMTDGLDGLATGLVIFVTLTFSLLTYLTGHVQFADYLGLQYLPNSGELAVLCAALTGGCLGFLWFNAYPAQIFMGDTGSLALGGVIGVISLLIKKEILLFLIGGVFVAETASVIIQVLYFKATGKRIFKMAPLHHHFELKGWKETQVVVRFWIIGGIFAILSLLTLKIQ